MTINPNEKIELIKICLPKVDVFKIPFINVFGTTDRVPETSDTDEPYLLWEDGSPILWEDGTKVLLEQQTKTIWRQRKARR